MLELRPHADAAEFLDSAQAWLRESDPTHHPLLAIARLLRGNSHFEPPFFLATVESGDTIYGCALRAPPDGLYLTDLPVEVIPKLAAQLSEMYTELREVIGPESIATAFAALWRPRAWKVHARLNCYISRSVAAPRRAVDGTLRAGTPDDLPLLRKWAPHYASEVDTVLNMQLYFERMIERGLLHLWDDNGARCVVTTSKLTANGAEVSALYTPPAYRGCGYATAAAAAATQRVLDTGRRYCMIAADQTAPVPNRIYRNIGFQLSSELAVVYFS